MNFIFKKCAVLFILPILMLQLVLSGCVSIFPQISHAKIAPAQRPILASYTPSRVLQFCVDTRPLYPDPLFRAAVSAVADMLGESVNVNEGEIQVYISYITSKSYLTDAFSFSVPAIGADPQEPTLQPFPDPAKFSSPYDLSAAVDKVKKENAQLLNAWQAQLKGNHEKLAAARDLVSQYASKFRSLPNIDDPVTEDVAGCLQAASERFRGFNGKKTLILASPLVTMVSNAYGIDLSGATVEIIFRSCQLASADACIAQAREWKQRFLSLGASSVSIHDPQESLVAKPTL